MTRRALALATLMLSNMAFAQAVTLQLSGANFRPMPVAIAQPVPQNPEAQASIPELDKTLLFDLAASGLFQVLDRRSFTADAKEGVTAGSINFSRWSDV